MHWGLMIDRDTGKVRQLLAFFKSNLWFLFIFSIHPSCVSSMVSQLVTCRLLILDCCCAFMVLVGDIAKFGGLKQIFLASGEHGIVLGATLKAR